MAQVKIVTDSAQDFEPEFLEAMGITVVPLNVHFGDESYKDWYQLRGKEFYEKLAGSDHIARTSQPSPWEFQQAFDELSKDGSAVVAIVLASALSGTYQSAVFAKEALPDRRIEVIDSKCASSLYGMIAILAQEMASEGKQVEEIVSAVNGMVDNAITVFSVDTLDYLARNGRIGKAQYFLGTLLNMKPVLALDKEGYVTSVERIRGKDKVIPRLVEIVKERAGEGEKVHLCISHANSKTESEKLKRFVQENLDVERLFETEIGSVIGAHAGPGTLGLFAIRSKAI